MQRIRFDRIDLPFRPPACDQFARDAESDTAGKRHRDGDDRIEVLQAGQPHSGRQLEEYPVEDIHAGAHGEHDQASDRADEHREHDQARFHAPAPTPEAAAVFPIH